MKYDYICRECDNEVTKEHRIEVTPRVVCICGGKMEKSFKNWGAAPLVKWKTNCPSASGGKECK